MGITAVFVLFCAVWFLAGIKIGQWMEQEKLINAK